MKRIAVVGAGMGGLAFAAAIRNSDIEVTVYEQASELGELGAGISLFANATRLFETLGIKDSMAGRCSEPEAFVFRNEDGSVVADQPLGRGNWYRDEYGSPYYGGLRRDLQSALLDVVGNGKIRLNKQLVGFDDSGDEARLTWTDGTVDTADLVVGADGIKSVLRSWVDDSDVVQFTGNSAFRGLARTADLTLLPEPKTITDWMGDGKHMLTFSVGKDYEFTTIVIFKDGPETWEHAEWRVPANAAELRAEFAGWHPAVLQALDHVNLAERWGMFACKPLPFWYRGRAVLIGDAAHSMMPHHGQGANTTFEDAIVLAEVLTDVSLSTLKEKLAFYQSKRKPRAERIQQVSRATNDCLHLPPGPERDRRSRLLHTLPKQFAWIHEPGEATLVAS